MKITIIQQAVANVLAQAPVVNVLDRAVFIDNLCFMYHTMLASERLLEEAIVETPSHFMGGELLVYFKTHLEEERDHAQWVADDLATADIDVTTRLPDMLAAAFAGTQYYLIKHYHPAALLGYMYVLENNPHTIEHVEQLEQAHGIPLCRTVRYHINHDVAHCEDLVDMIERLPVEQFALVYHSAVTAATYLVEASKALASMENNHGV